ncbi:hypothetical protein BJV82DRAFT_608577 [Fennellomyces sp. T-0311]|nr:hypothetical protein BJV82DRAFT_608577 [Fennellomyces sp. T-0311]
MEAIRIFRSLIAQAWSIGVFAAIQDAIYHHDMLPDTLLPIFALCKGVISGNNKRSAFKSLIILLYLNVKTLCFQLLHYILAIISKRLEHCIAKKSEKAISAPPIRTQVLVEQRRVRVKTLSIADRLSLEIWQNILNNICPSQLTKVAQVSKKLAEIVTSLPLWQHISITAKLGEIKARGRRRTYYGMVLSSSHRICEHCYKVCRRNAPYQAALPLHVEEQSKTVRLCLDCRRNYLMKSPESQNQYIVKKYGGQVGLDAVQQRRKAIIEKKEIKEKMQLDTRALELHRSAKSLQNGCVAREPHFQRS